MCHSSHHHGSDIGAVNVNPSNTRGGFWNITCGTEGRKKQLCLTYNVRAGLKVALLVGANEGHRNPRRIESAGGAGAGSEAELSVRREARERVLFSARPANHLLSYGSRVLVLSGPGRTDAIGNPITGLSRAGWIPRLLLPRYFAVTPDSRSGPGRPTPRAARWARRESRRTSEPPAGAG